MMDIAPHQTKKRQLSVLFLTNLWHVLIRDSRSLEDDCAVTGGVGHVTGRVGVVKWIVGCGGVRIKVAACLTYYDMSCSEIADCKRMFVSSAR